MTRETHPVLPPFRWPGGKRRLVQTLLANTPTSFGTYYEPFAGAAALFFYLQPRPAQLSDHNSELINFYSVLRDDFSSLLSSLQGLRTDSASYYAIRATTPTDEVMRAARFMYLTTLAFGGIYRVNQAGRFNTPYGHRKYDLTDGERLRSLSAALHGVDLRACDFEEAVESAVANDFVYFDPPYTVAHQNNGFLRYNERIYSFDDQRRLARVATQLAARGVFVLISNAHHQSISDLLKDFHVDTIRRQSLVAASPAKRGEVLEYLFSANIHGAGGPDSV